MADSIPTAWRSVHDRSRARPRRRLLLVLLALVAVAGMGVGALMWLSPPRTPAFVPVWIAVEPGSADIRGAVPWSAQDYSAFTDGGWLGHLAPDSGLNPSRDQIRLRLKALNQRKGRQPVVVYLSAPAGVDAGGQPYLLAADPIGDHPRNRILLSEALELIRDCSSAHKLLILDLWPLGRPGVAAPPPGAVATAAVLALETVADERRLCLISCDAGQAPRAAPALGRTPFGHYLEAGLRGAADGWNPSANRDGRVSVAELSAYVRARVARLSESVAGIGQTPRLFGQAEDFTLRSDFPDEVLAFYAAPPAAGPGPYPEWLKAAWEEQDRLSANPRSTQAAGSLASRAHALLTAEEAWAGGRPPAEVEAELKRALSNPTPSTSTPISNPAPSLAALGAAPLAADPKLPDELKAAVLKAEARPPSPPPAKPSAKAGGFELWPELEPFKARSHAALAAAAFALIANDPAAPPSRIEQLDHLLAAQEAVPRYAETLLLHRVAERLADPSAGPLEPAQMALALRTGRDFEQAAVSPEVLEWAKAALDEAYRRWAAARAALFSPGYVSAELAEERLVEAADAVRQVKVFADSARGTTVLRDSALHSLASAYPTYAAGLVALPAAERLAGATRALVVVMNQPTVNLTLETLAARDEEWRRHATDVRLALAEFSRPFTPAAVAALRNRTTLSDATPAAARQVRAVLQTSLVRADDRPLLRAALFDLDKRLSEVIARQDAADDEAVAKRTLAVTGYRDPTEPAPLTARLPDTLSGQEQWSKLLLRAAGLNEEPARPGAADEQARLEWLRKLWYEEVPTSTSIESRRVVEWAVPDALSPANASRPATPIISPMKAVWAWQTSRFDYESHDPIDAAGVAFATEAARSCRLASNASGSEPYADIVPPPFAGFEPETKAATFNVGYRVVGAAGPALVAVEPITPFPDWLLATSPPKLDLMPGREVLSPVRLAVGAGQPPAGLGRGVLIEATVAGRTFHRRIPINLDAVMNRLDLLVQANPKAAPRTIKDLRLRPHGLAQPYYFQLANPGARPRTVAVRLTNLGVVSPPVTVPARSFVALAFPAPPPLVPPAPAVAGAKPVPPAPDLRELDEALEFEVLEGEAKKVVQRFEVPVEVAEPNRYLAVTDVVFRPAVGGRPNNLSARIVPDTPLANPPCQIELLFPADRNPGLIVRDGKLKGTIPADGQPLRLYAENMTVHGIPPRQMVLTLSADGSDRAFTYAGQLPPDGETVRLEPVTAPLIRVKAAEFATGIVPLPVKAEVDNAPDGARIELRLGTIKDDRFVSDAERVIDSPRERLASAGVQAKDGAVLLRAELKDWETTLPVEFLVGVRELEARLRDAGGRVLAEDRIQVTFDNAPPANIQFLGLDPRVRKDKPLTLRATCDPTISGVKEVKFFLGKPINNAPPASITPVAGKLVDKKANIWEAVLPPGHGGPTTATALFTSRAGLTGAGTQDFELVDPKEVVKPDPGTIAGKVIEGALPQGGLDVVLYDAKGEVARAKTNPAGAFEFPDLVPGKYRLIVEKESTGRKADHALDLKPGETTKLTLELFL